MYDYIVIGAGTAGCTLAARLSEDPSLNVLLIEAGPPHRHSAIRTPLAYPSLFRSRFDWNFWTEPQVHLGNRRLYWPRGRVLGGSGSIHAMVRTNPCRGDIDAWGIPGWTFDDLALSADAPPVSEPNPLTEAFLRACESSGLPRKAVLVDAGEPSCGLFRVDIRKGVRHGPAQSHLDPALPRGSLTVWTGITVPRIVIQAGRARGVEYLQGGSIGRVEATREVILCAGAIGSPHLLMLSGIGPARELERLGIAPVADVEAVGENLHDRLAAPVSYTCTAPVSLSGAFTAANRMKHRLRRKGPLASNGVEAGAFFSSEKNPGGCNLELVFAPVFFVDHGLAKPGGHGFTLISALLAPRSRGRLTLVSADPRESPAIDPAYLSVPADREQLSHGVRFARQVADQESFAAYRGKPILGDLDPEEHIRAWGQTLYHPAGACRMGTDEGSVVDASLRVRGVSGLRVADASVIPTLPRAHPNTLVAAIGEKAARMIRES